MAIGAAVVTLPLGPLRGTMLLVVALPPLAHALDRLGWAEIAARRLAGRGHHHGRVLAAYGAWLVVSALLTLDVAAVVATPVGLAIARRWRAGQRMHVAAAILGSNVGSLIFPFSNLTNLLVLAGAGTGFAAYVRAALAPQIAAAVAVGLILYLRRRATADHPDRWRPEPDVQLEPPDAQLSAAPERPWPDAVTLVAGGIAGVGALAAVAVGLAGGDVALTFLVIGAACGALATWDGRAELPGLLRTIPLTGVGVVLLAALAREPMVELAATLPQPQASLPLPLALAVFALVGGLLSAAINNLPAAAFGSVWLVGASPEAVVAYLLGTNILALLTPHGSLATILGRSLAKAAGAHLPTIAYVRDAWRYALGGTAAGLLALIAFGGR